MKTSHAAIARLALGASLTLGSFARAAPDALADSFAKPSPDARPLVFWQWVNGNVTPEGIRLDLQWMQRAGIAGALMFDIGFRSPPVPQFVDKRVGFGTPEWQEAVRVAGDEARKLGLVLGAQSSGGWSVSGGPEVAPTDGMKKLVWAETVLTAPFPRPVVIAARPVTPGAFQDFLDYNTATPDLHGAIAVMAYRLPDAEQTESPPPVLRGIDGASTLTDGNYLVSVKLPPDANGSASFTATPSPGTRLRSLTLAVAGSWPKGAIEGSDDGVSFHAVIDLPAPAAQSAPVHTFTLNESARVWRVRFTDLEAPLELTEARFDAGARIDRFEEKAGFGVLAAQSSPQADEVGTAIDPDDIVDVTEHVKVDDVGSALDWSPRNGRWVVVTFGWSLTDRMTVPATPESRGFEVDKLDAQAVRRFATSFYGRYRRALGLTTGDPGPLGVALTDSWEAGQQNWTPAMLAEFRKRRGYDLTPWLPVLTGRIVGNVARSERVLADFRRTIADLLADSHYAVLSEVAHANGMHTWSEAAGTGSPTNIDGLQAKGRVDVPMGEYWYYPEGTQPDPDHVADIREAASAAHTYGKRIVAAEALTTRGEAPFAQGPREWRRIVDRFFAEGVNRIVMHTSAHQPFVDRKPGITLRQYGQHFTRNETWAEDAVAWTDYLARTSQLLQSGKSVADVAVFVGDEVPAMTRDAQRPAGFDFDFIDAELLLRAQARDGRLVLDSGASYRALVKPADSRIQAGALRDKLRALTAQGVLVIDANADVAKALHEAGVAPDVALPAHSTLLWTHRATADADIYFVTNQSAKGTRDLARFRVRDRHVETWDAVTGARADAIYAPLDDGTLVEILLDPYESRFVVFRGTANARYSVRGIENKVINDIRGHLAKLDGPWKLEFLDERGAPEAMTLPALVSWTQSSDPAIRWYSGRARYSRDFEARPDWLEFREPLMLDLGAFHALAHVYLNGVDLGVSWTAPGDVDVRKALKAGTNHLEIVVTNYWANRMIGDKQPGATPVTFSSLDPFTAASPPRPAGLLGPVVLERVFK